MRTLAALVRLLRIVHLPVSVRREDRAVTLGDRRLAVRQVRLLRRRLDSARSRLWRYRAVTGDLDAPARRMFDILLAEQFYRLAEDCHHHSAGLLLAARVLSEDSENPGVVTEDQVLEATALLPSLGSLLERGLAEGEELMTEVSRRTRRPYSAIMTAELTISPAALQALFPSLTGAARARTGPPSWFRPFEVAAAENEETEYGRLFVPEQTLDRVVLPPSLRERALLAARATQRPPQEGRGATTGGCLLLHGPPGTGKTLTAEAIATEINRLRSGSGAGRAVRLLLVDYASLASPYVGENERRLGGLLRRWDPATEVLFFDEADSLVARRIAASGGHDAASLTFNRLTNLLLKELEDLRGGVVIFATNFGDHLDPAMERRARFRLRFEEPGQEEREALWRIHIPPGVHLAPDVDFRALAVDYPLTGGLIRNAVENAVMLAEGRVPNRWPPRLDQETLSAAAATEEESRIDGRALRTVVGFRTGCAKLR